MRTITSRYEKKNDFVNEMTGHVDRKVYVLLINIIVFKIRLYV